MCDVLVIPNLTKNLLSISKLILDHPFHVLFFSTIFKNPRHYWFISSLKNLGVLHTTSILSKHVVCKPCQLSKGQRLSFELNSKHFLHTLDLVYCDLWGPGPSHVLSNGYLYYVIFVSLLCHICGWSLMFHMVLPIKSQSSFCSVLTTFIKLVQIEFSRKIKVFLSYGGTEFVNNMVHNILE